MNWKRILRDGSIVSLLCAVFFFSARAIHGTNKSENRTFSSDRRLAEQYFADRKWELASVQFGKLTEQDPFNGHAWFYQAVCYTWIISEVEKDIKSTLDSGAADTELAQLQSVKRINEDKAIECFRKSCDFLRHRRRALVNIAAVYVGRKDWEKAIDCLAEYIDEGNLIARSLEGVTNLGMGGRKMLNQDPESNPDAGLHCFPEFWALVDRERQIRGF